MTALCLVTALVLPAPSAFADSTPSPAPTLQIETYKDRMDRFKKEREAFENTLKDRATKMRLINSDFKKAVDKAISDAKIALVSANTPAQKSAISTTRQSAIAAAIAARENAIAALGALPTPPAPPMRDERSTKEKKGEKEKEKQKR